MSISTGDLTVDDFLGSDWESVPSKRTIAGITSYDIGYLNLSDKAKDGGDERLSRLYDFLAHVSSLHLDLDRTGCPLVPGTSSKYGRSASLDDFDDTAVDYLAAILPHVTDPEMVARIGDMLWELKRQPKQDYRAAQTAIDAYLSVAAHDNPDDWESKDFDYLRRSLDLCSELHDTTRFQQAQDQIEKAIEQSLQYEKPGYVTSKLMEVLQRRGLGDGQHYGPMCIDSASEALKENDWYRARAYYDLAAEWFRMAKDEQRTTEARVQSAESFVLQADSMLKGSSAPYTLAAEFLASGVRELRKIPGQRSRADQLHVRLVETQQRALSEMTPVVDSIDGSEMFKRAKEAISGKDFQQALWAYVNGYRSTSVSFLRSQAEEISKGFLLGRFFGTSLKNAMGRTIARQEPSDDPEQKLLMDMYRNAALAQNIAVQGWIEPGRYFIGAEHSIRFDALEPIVRHNPFVAYGREGYYVRGLHAGFHGDFAVAAHLLIPQIEHSIRALLEENGTIPSSLDDDGIQDEYNLNKTLRDPYASKLAEILGEDIVFDLRGLLIERFGSNLRNDIAHGLIPYSYLYAHPPVYLWWLALRICTLFAHLPTAAKTGSPEGATDTGDEQQNDCE